MTDDELTFFDPRGEVRMHRNRLPHWQQEHATYFVTWHLADSLPREILERWDDARDAWLRLHPPPWTAAQQDEFQRLFRLPVEKWLDELHGECVLRAPAAAAIVAETLGHFDQVQYRHHAWIVMPNHVHVLFSLEPGHALEKVLKAWKGVSARRINTASNRTGSTLWQKDYFDRLIRDREHFWNVARYIRRNPGRANLRAGECLAYESDKVREVLDFLDGL